MMRIISESVDISASPRQVWSVLADLAESDFRALNQALKARVERDVAELR